MNSIMPQLCDDILKNILDQDTKLTSSGFSLDKEFAAYATHVLEGIEDFLTDFDQECLITEHAKQEYRRVCNRVTNAISWYSAALQDYQAIPPEEAKELEEQLRKIWNEVKIIKLYVDPNSPSGKRALKTYDQNREFLKHPVSVVEIEAHQTYVEFDNVRYMGVTGVETFFALQKNLQSSWL